MAEPQGDMPMPMPMPKNPAGSPMAPMHMTFFWGKGVVMLFNNWPNGELGMYILALLLVFFLAAGVEFLAGFKPAATGTRRSPFIGSLAHASVYTVRMGLAYLVMLSVMSYNLGVFIVALAGHALGSLLVNYRELSVASQKAQVDPISIPKV